MRDGGSEVYALEPEAESSGNGESCLARRRALESDVAGQPLNDTSTTSFVHAFSSQSFAYEALPLSFCISLYEPYLDFSA